MNTILPTKFFLPPKPAGFVDRPQLLLKLDEALAHRLVLVSAPAGAGKSTLISAWIQALRKKGVACGWLSLDSADNDPRRFLEYLVACLEEGGMFIDTAEHPSWLGEQELTENIIVDFIRGLVNIKREIMIILDDYHLIQNIKVHDLLEYLLAHAPTNLHLVLLTRSDPPLELARMRVAGQLVELRMEHLRFSVQETTTFLKKVAGVQLTETDVVMLNTRAEGWIAGLQMAAISLRGREDTSAFVAVFAGSHRFVFDYLLEQVLNRQSPEVRSFLLQTSVLERLSAPLCDAVTGGEGTAHKWLDTLERENLFLTPLDDEREWYRYHHLFTELLSLVLEQTYPGLSIELHRRACHWLEVHGLLPDALHHALLAGDMELVARLVSANVLVLVDHAELEPILIQMDAIPRERRGTLPWVEVAYAWGLAYAGQMDRAEVELSLAEKQSVKVAGNERDRMMGHIAAVRAYVAWANGNQQQAIKFASDAEHLLPLEEIAVRALNLTTLGNALTQYAADPHAAEVLEQALTLARQAGQSHVIMPSATALAYSYLVLCKFYKAERICLEAIEIAKAYEQRFGQSLPAVASAYTFMARICEEHGEKEKAVIYARKGLAMAEVWGQADTVILCLIYLADALQFNGDTPEALQTIHRARNIAKNISSWFLMNVDEMELRILLDADRIKEATYLASEMEKDIPHWLEALLLMKQGRLEGALSLIEGALPTVLKITSVDTLRLLVCQSITFYKNKDEVRAFSSIKQALALAEPENMVATFVREGAAMEILLRQVLTRSAHPEFIRHLLAVSETRKKVRQSPVLETLIEPLSERELEVLQQLNGPLSTPEIARQLVVSTNTIRTHIKNIYAKLGVHGRSGAVRRANELGLLK